MITLCESCGILIETDDDPDFRFYSTCRNCHNYSRASVMLDKTSKPKTRIPNWWFPVAFAAGFLGAMIWNFLK